MLALIDLKRWEVVKILYNQMIFSSFFSRRSTNSRCLLSPSSPHVEFCALLVVSLFLQPTFLHFQGRKGNAFPKSDCEDTTKCKLTSGVLVWQAEVARLVKEYHLDDLLWVLSQWDLFDSALKVEDLHSFSANLHLWSSLCYRKRFDCEQTVWSRLKVEVWV